MSSREDIEDVPFYQGQVVFHGDFDGEILTDE